MKNPFIILTAIETGQKVRVNILHIISYTTEKFKDLDRKYMNSDKTYTYVTTSKSNYNSFIESVEEIDEAINAYYGG